MSFENNHLATVAYVGFCLVLISMFLAISIYLSRKCRIHRHYFFPAFVLTILISFTIGIWFLFFPSSAITAFNKICIFLYVFFGVEILIGYGFLYHFEGKYQHLSAIEKDEKLFEPLTIKEIIVLKRRLYFAGIVFAVILISTWIYLIFK